jgi:GxxExxY protein
MGGSSDQGHSLRFFLSALREFCERLSFENLSRSDLALCAFCARRLLRSSIIDWTRELKSNRYPGLGGNFMDLNQLSSQVIKAPINVHKTLGPGLLESVYQSCMVIELKDMGLEVQAEVPLPILYRGQKVHEEGFRLDLLVEDTIIAELKSVEKIQDLHKKQLLTYLRLTQKPLGLLINFNEILLKEGITRIINNPPTADE